MSRRRQRGSVTTEVVVLMPALVSLVAFIVYAGRMTDASNSLYRAVDAAARTASQSRESMMERRATSTVVSQLSDKASGCRNNRVSFSTLSNGRLKVVTVRASCVVNRSGLGLLALPKVTLSAESSEVIDYYTQR